LGVIAFNFIVGGESSNSAVDIIETISRGGGLISREGKSVTEALVEDVDEIATGSKVSFGSNGVDNIKIASEDAFITTSAGEFLMM